MTTNQIGSAAYRRLLRLTDPGAQLDSISAEDYRRLHGQTANDLLPRESKYGNVKTEVDGIVFDSKAEAKRYGELKLLLRSGDIQSLVWQPKLPIVVNGIKVATYIADFTYFDMRKPGHVFEDVKGVRTAVYKLKKKLVKACLDIDIVEI